MAKNKAKKQSRGDFYFAGFGVPETNYFKMPKEWTDLTAKITSLAELKVVEYVLKHTWGYQEYGITKKITIDEFMHGRKRKDGTRIDRGTGLSNRSVITGLRRAVGHGLLIEEVDDRDKARIKKSYALRMKQQEKAPDLDVKNVHTGVKNVHSNGVKSSQRSEKDTLERNSVVVNVLKEFKIEEDRAQQLTTKFTSAHIEEKIELLQWKLQTKTRGRPIEDPAAWLIRAIERDYKPPPTFKTKEERKKQAEALAREEAEWEKHRQQLRAEARQQTTKYLQKLRQEYGTTQKELDLWAEVLREISLQTTKPTFDSWFTGTSLLRVEDGEAVIGVRNKYAKDWLEARLYKIIKRSIDPFLPAPVELKFVIIERPA